MARIRVVFDGATSVNGSALMMHNERLSDPIDPHTRWLAELTKKRTKTEQDHEEIGRREFFGGGYWAVDEGPGGKHLGPIIPSWNVVRCLQAAATRHKLGKHVVRGLVPVTDDTPLIYAGPTDGDELWKAGTFHTRKGVGIGGKRTMRTRPTFDDWKVDLELELDLTILDPDTVNMLAIQAGMYEGLGDNRPRFGRFLGSAVLLGDAADYVAPDEVLRLRSSLATTTAATAISGRDEQHAASHPNGKERAKRVAAKVS